MNDQNTHKGAVASATPSPVLYVVDTSIALKWFVKELNSVEAKLYLGLNIDRHAPDLMPLEATHALLKRSRGQNPDLTPNFARSVMISLRDFTLIDYHPCSPLLELALELAYEIGSSSYDGLFLALAIRLDGRVVTADRKFFDKVDASRHRDRGRWFLDPP